MAKDISQLPTRFEAHKIEIDRTNGLALLMIETDHGPIQIRMDREVLRDFYERGKPAIERLVSRDPRQ